MQAHETLLEILAGRARAEPERIAFHFRGEPRPYDTLWRDAGRFATALVRRGLGRGDRVVVVVPNGPEFFNVFYGIERAGGVPVPLFPGSGWERLIAMATRCGARLVVVSESSMLEPLAAAGLEVVLANAPLPVAVDEGLPKIGPDDLAYIQYTSGSTGEPKGVEIRHAALVTNLRQMIAGMEITEEDVFVSWLPVHHDMGLVLMTMVPFYLGIPLFLLPTSLRQPEIWLSEIERQRATFTAAPDFAYRVCLRRVRDSGSFDLSRLRVALNAAEPVRRQTLTEFERTFGLRGVMMPAYGLAEATVGVSMCKPGEPVRIDDRGFVSVGRPFPEVDVAILADGGMAGPEEVGEILVRSPANTRGYWRDPKATQDLLRDDGYLHTGDLGYLDANDELFVVGRRKSLIIQGGRNLAPREIEEAVDLLPFVRASAAVGVDRGGDEGEQAYLFVELRTHDRHGPSDFAELTVQVVDAVRSHLGLRPGRVYLVPAGAIPRTHNGKIRYKMLQDGYLDGSLRAAGKLLFPDY